jgi:hypothetical protein
MELPAAIKQYWDSLPAPLSSYLLRFQYAEASLNPPVAIFRPNGFGRKRLNAGFYYDTHRYEFTLINLVAESAYEDGFLAMQYMQDLAVVGIIRIDCDPDDFATPVEEGQANSWAFRFVLDIDIQPGSVTES